MALSQAAITQLLNRPARSRSGRNYERGLQLEMARMQAMEAALERASQGRGGTRTRRRLGLSGIDASDVAPGTQAAQDLGRIRTLGPDQQWQERRSLVERLRGGTDPLIAPPARNLRDLAGQRAAEREGGESTQARVALPSQQARLVRGAQQRLEGGRGTTRSVRRLLLADTDQDEIRELSPHAKTLLAQMLLRQRRNKPPMSQRPTTSGSNRYSY